MTNTETHCGTRLVWALAAALLVGGCWDPHYVCSSDENCVRGGVGGYCLPTTSGKACIFPDNGCVNRLRWDNTAPDDVAGRCVQLACDDKAQNGLPAVENGRETDVDCGGLCPPCADGKGCALDADCVSRACIGGSCAPPTCSDRRRNGTESAVDCGGVCSRCEDGSACNSSADCKSDDCWKSLCRTPQCNDDRRNGSETDKDCGGPTCVACAAGAACKEDRDCITRSCAAGRCTSYVFATADKLTMAITGAANPIDLLAIDLDGTDGIDLLVDNQEGAFLDNRGVSQLILLRNNGRANFTSGGTSTSINGLANGLTMVSADFNGDGRPDVALPSNPYAGRGGWWEVSILVNNGATLVGRQEMLTDASLGAAVGDFNNDSLPDVAFTLVNRRVGLVKSTGNGGFESNYPRDGAPLGAAELANDPPGGNHLIAADINEDGYPDLVYPSSIGGVATAINKATPKGEFVFGRTIPVGTGIVGALGHGDFNGDKHEDLACVASSGDVVVMLGDGKGGFSDPRFAKGAAAADLVVADMDGDGNLDVVSSSTGIGLKLLVGNGKGDLATGGNLALPEKPNEAGAVKSLVVSDFNGDKLLDVAGIALKSKSVYVWKRSPP